MIPTEIADEVQLWAREHGRRFGRVEWNAMLGCAVIHFGRRLDDPMMREFQEGRLAEEPTESVRLHEWDPKENRWEPWDLAEYGASGIRSFLDRANLLSGRGEHASLQDSVLAVRRSNEALKREMSAQQAEAGREAGWLARRTDLELPLVPVLKDI